MTTLAAVDLGGTHVRFALAEVTDKRVWRVGEPVVLACAAFPSFAAAWARFVEPLTDRPRDVALAVASRVQEGPFKLTNIDWVIDRDNLKEALGLDRLLVINDFAAVGHAIAHLDPSHFLNISGDESPLAKARVISIVGPGTGLGVAQIVRGDHGYEVIPSEGGHIGFSPADAVDDAVLARAREKFGRASAERILAGPGLSLFTHVLADQAGGAALSDSDKALWSAVLEGRDPLTQTVLERYCLGLGRFAGDIALAHGADALVVAGGHGLRLGKRLAEGPFARGFCDKGRFAAWMKALPVSMVTHAQPGLFGAAAAFAEEFET